MLKFNVKLIKFKQVFVTPIAIHVHISFVSHDAENQ